MTKTKRSKKKILLAVAKSMKKAVKAKVAKSAEKKIEKKMEKKIADLAPVVRPYARGANKLKVGSQKFNNHSVKLKGTDFLLPINVPDAAAATDSGTVLLNLSLNRTAFNGTRVVKFFDMYERYRVHKMTLRFVPNVATTQAGQLVHMVDADPGDDDWSSNTLNVQSILAHERAKVFSIYKPSSVSLPKTHDYTDLWTSANSWYGDAQNASDDRLTTAGQYVLATVAQIPVTNIGQIGSLYMDWEIEFFVPSLSYSAIVAKTTSISTASTSFIGGVLHPMFGKIGVDPSSSQYFTAPYDEGKFAGYQSSLVDLSPGQYLIRVVGFGRGDVSPKISPYFGQYNWQDQTGNQILPWTELTSTSSSIKYDAIGYPTTGTTFTTSNRFDTWYREPLPNGESTRVTASATSSGSSSTVTGYEKSWTINWFPSKPEQWLQAAFSFTDAITWQVLYLTFSIISLGNAIPAFNAFPLSNTKQVYLGEEAPESHFDDRYVEVEEEKQVSTSVRSQSAPRMKLNFR